LWFVDAADRCRHGGGRICSWNDLPDLLHATGGTHARDATRKPSEPLPLERLTTALAKYLQLQEREYLTIALWIAHSFVYQRFMVSPRLALANPVRRCGKTTALSLLAALCHRGERFDGLTPAGAKLPAVSWRSPLILLNCAGVPAERGE